MKALGHPSRLLMVDRLAGGERCVRDLAAMVGADVSTVSRHLSVLKTTGIVSAGKRRNQVFYRLRVPCVLRFFDCVGAVLRSLAAEDQPAKAGRRAPAPRS